MAYRQIVWFFSSNGLEWLTVKVNFRNIEMKSTPSYIYVRWASSIFMILMLLWLTVSAPFVTSFQLQMVEKEKGMHQHDEKECKEKNASDCNPFANTTEEKTESGSISFSEEYLHDPYELIHTLDDLLRHANCGHSALYIAFHGELLSPPPEV